MLAKYSSLVLVIFSWWQLRGLFSQANPTCRGEEREALLSFKRGLTDPSNRLSSWVGEDCCAWRGVHCHNITRHVTRLSLRNTAQNPSVLDHPNAKLFSVYNRSRLSGNISPSLTQLKQLQHLDLSQNDFGGAQVPEFFGSLANLRYLNLTSAEFGGTIPSRLGNLSSLRFLALGSRYNSDMDAYKGLEWISHLSSLEFLDLSGINLEGASNWPQMVNMLPFLSELHLSDCHLTNITPVSHVNFSSLTILDLSSNSLDHSVFRWLFPSRTPYLLSLDLSNNQIGGAIPNSLQNMTNIRSLRLASNKFNSTIPAWLYNYTNLETLDLSSNYFQGTISKAIGNNLCNLRVLDLGDNNLDGCLSKYIRYLSSCTKEKLEKLSLWGNQVSGHLPHQLGEFKRLSYIDISSCSLNATIPKSIGRLSKLEVLDISNNSFPGTLSQVFFVNLTRLRFLHVEANPYLSFEFYSNWTPPFQLQSLYMSNTKVGPQFPIWLRSQKNLEELVMCDAGISVPIPTWISSLSHLYHLDLSRNHIPGSIPDLSLVESIFIGSNALSGPLPHISSRVIRLDLSNNSIRGSLAPFLCQKLTDEKTNLHYLDLSKNLLSGELTDCWGKWENLVVLKLSHNNFTGELPRSMHSLFKLQFLYIRRNNLSGILSQTLQSWGHHLQVIDLSENEISGSLPGSMLEHFAELRILALRSNRLTGIIPLELCQLKSLQIVDLAYNQLSKTIPKCFGNFKEMIQIIDQLNFPLGCSYAFPNNHFKFHVTETLNLVVKDKELEYSSNLEWVTGIDLSSNNLSGEIPKELTSLHNLHAFESLLESFERKDASRNWQYEIIGVSIFQ